MAATTYCPPETVRFLEDSLPLLPLVLLPLCSFEVGVAPEEEEMICQPLAPWESCVAVRSSSPVPPDWLGPWELLLFSLGDSILLQVAASRAKGDGWDSWPEIRERKGVTWWYPFARPGGSIQKINSVTVQKGKKKEKPNQTKSWIYLYY